MRNVKISLLVISAITLTCCNQKDIMIYENDPKVYFELPGPGGQGTRDSLVFSFPVTENPEADLLVRVRLMGDASPVARAISIGVVEGETTAAPADYTLPTTVEMPANAYLTDIPVTVKREGLTNRSVTLVLEIKQNGNFGVGFDRGRTTKLVWGDMYLKPDNWDSSNYLNCWGEFSQVKYGFILSTCNITELPLPTNLYVLGYYNSLVREALYRYEQENGGPLVDENDAPVQVPVWSGGGGGLG